MTRAHANLLQLSVASDAPAAAMDDSVRRSSKRRKLDTPTRIAPSPPATGSATRTGRLAKKVAAGTAAKHNRAPEVDIYDDIEGAMGVAPTARPAQRRPRVAAQDKPESTAEELRTVAALPKRGKGRPTNAEKARREAAQRSIDSDQLAGANTKTPAVSARSLAVPRSRARTAKAGPATDEHGGAAQPGSRVPHATPSKLRSTRKPSARVRTPASPEDDQDEPLVAMPSKSVTRQNPTQRQSTLPDTGDELGRPAPPSSTKRTASARRRFNRTDHISNVDEEATLQVDAESDHQDDDAMDVDGNSVLESVLDPTEPSPFNKPTSAQKEKSAPPLIYGNLPAGRELDLLKTIVLERIAAKRPSPLVGLDAEYKSVHQLIEQTVTAGEGNSMLMIGARGSGKTALVNKVLSEVAKDNGGDYHVVRLNGFIHTDDKIALREIWRQLGKEMDIEEDGSGPGKNYADTLTTLLALLSHPSEQTGEITDHVAKAVIFVMDEFDLFALHPRQTLLYNLFDIAQSRKAPIAVIGLTTRIDVTNSLEKRVKSRFSHRYVHLSLAKTFTAYQEMCRAGLVIELEHLSVEERGILEGGTKSSTANGTPAKKSKRDAKESVLTEWNNNINVSTPQYLAMCAANHNSETLYNFILHYPTPRAAFLPHKIHPRDAEYLLHPNRQLGLRHTVRTHQRPQSPRLKIIHHSPLINTIPLSPHCCCSP
jgi:origin recognition complex subunit 4